MSLYHGLIRKCCPKCRESETSSESRMSCQKIQHYSTKPIQNFLLFLHLVGIGPKHKTITYLSSISIKVKRYRAYIKQCRLIFFFLTGQVLHSLVYFSFSKCKQQWMNDLQYSNINMEIIKDVIMLYISHGKTNGWLIFMAFWDL